MNEVAILYGSLVVGEAKIQRQGLYYLFSCSCRFSKSGIYKLWAASAGKQIKLGVCVPEKNCYTLYRKIPTAHFGDDEISVYVMNEDERKIDNQPKGELVSLEKLDQAVLEIVNGDQVVCIKDQFQAQSDNDPNPIQ